MARIEVAKMERMNPTTNNAVMMLCRVSCLISLCVYAGRSPAPVLLLLDVLPISIYATGFVPCAVVGVVDHSVNDRYPMA